MIDRITVEDRVNSVLENLVLQGFEILPESTFLDMGLDSIDKIEFCMDLEDEFKLEIPDEVMHHLENVEDVVYYISRFVK